MQMPPRLAAIFAVVFAGICLWFAIDQFVSLGSITDPAELSGAKQFAWFWSFLAAVGLVIGVLCWKLYQTQMKDEDA